MIRDNWEYVAISDDVLQKIRNHVDGMSDGNRTRFREICGREATKCADWETEDDNGQLMTLWNLVAGLMDEHDLKRKDEVSRLNTLFG
jgi:hypothetical protein